MQFYCWDLSCRTCLQPGLNGPEDLAPGEGAVMRKGLQPVAAFRDDDVSQTVTIFVLLVTKGESLNVCMRS